MKPAPIWKPRKLQRAASNLSAYASWLDDTGVLPNDGENYELLWRWSIENRAAFWKSIWQYCDIHASKEPKDILVDDAMPGAKWFVGARFNFAENLLRLHDQSPALVACDERGRRRNISHAELNMRVARLAAALRRDGIKPGDRIAAFLPNCAEAVIGMLAATSMGAIWSSCSPDFGAKAVIDRFGQIEPKILIACDGYLYAGKAIDTRDRVREIRAALPTVRHLLIVPFLNEQPDLAPLKGKGATLFDDFATDGEMQFVQLPFEHPLYILYSSGTTGVPKCIVHSVGGTLLQHLKEHVLHCDVKPGDRLFFFTTCGWMMWNWLASGLAAGAVLVLYDGSPMHPSPAVLWEIAEREKLTHFGTSPKYLASLQQSGYRVKDHSKLDKLRAILSTGSPLAPEQFDFVYDAVKRDQRLSSISGGTDIVSCFALGNPWDPIVRGELQCRGLGMAVDAFDAQGRPVRGEPGELVCTKAFPSMPIGFWNDGDGKKYRAAYFERFPGVWHHGDWCEITERGTVIIQGRSDATLNPGGVRIGTAEIYRVVEAVPEIVESVAVGFRHDNDERVILFVRLRDGERFTESLEQKLKSAIRAQLSPRHVPSKVLPCPEVPRTMSGKVTEIAVRELIHGRAVSNADALANPQSLDYFRGITREELL
ncbi:MAG TPA: acetoacetate--CoA ligase [Nevskiaceae bacterium]|nr:acetoacetate--CoA ligase [Nevskiaceae bacterium]